MEFPFSLAYFIFRNDDHNTTTNNTPQYFLNIIVNLRDKDEDYI